MPTAIVTGATGILGREIVSLLGKDPQTWTQIHALSRSQKEEYPKNVSHDHIDLASDAQAMAKQLQGVSATHIFFAAYLQEDSEQKNWDTNGAMLKNFIEALTITGAIKDVKRFVLVTGAKQYGLHLGRVKVPMEESDPRIDSPERPPNFYYNQQDILFAEAKEHGFDWVVTYPNDVIGYAVNNFMNLTTPLALYATVSKELSGDLEWPGSEAFYFLTECLTSSKLHADFCQWAALTPRAGNQAFNMVNGDVISWQRLWPQVAKRFGCKVPENMFSKKPTHNLPSERKLADDPPIGDFAAKETGLVGSKYLKPSAEEARIDLDKWSQLPEVKNAWEKIAIRDGLDREAFGKAPWWFLKFILGRNFDILISGNKAREFGYTGFKDTWASLEEVFVELEDAKIIPKRRHL